MSSKGNLFMRLQRSVLTVNDKEGRCVWYCSSTSCFMQKLWWQLPKTHKSETRKSQKV